MTTTNFMTVDEVAAIFRVQRRTVIRWVNRGRLPAVRIGRSPRIPRECVEKMIAEAKGES